MRIQNAKIITVGERAEDVFYIWDECDKPLTEEACESLRTALVDALAAQQSA